MEKLLLLITNEIFRQGRVPETLKAGLLTPIFKNKGLKTQATNNRGIAVLPVISKIVEPIIKVRIQNQVLEIQSRTQRDSQVVQHQLTQPCQWKNATERL